MGSFSLWIPPSFVLSPNVPVTNAQSIWLRFGAFLSPPARFLRIHWPFCFRPTLHAPRPTPHAPRPTPHASRPTAPRPTGGVRSCAGPSPAGECLTPTAVTPTAELRKTERGPISRSGLSILLCHRTRRFLWKNQSFSPRSSPSDRRPFSLGWNRSTPVAPGVPAGWP